MYLLVSLGEGNGTPLQYSCLENPMDGGAWKAAVHGVAEGQTRLHFHSHFSLSFFTFMPWRRKWQPTPVFLPGNPRDGGAWWAAVYGVAQSWTRLKWLSSISFTTFKFSKLLISVLSPLIFSLSLRLICDLLYNLWTHIYLFFPFY